MPNFRPTLAEWLAMTPAQVKAQIQRGVMPPIIGADGEGEGGEGEPKPQGEPAGGGDSEPKAPTAEDVANLQEALRKERDRSNGLDKQVKELKPKADAHDQLTAEQQSDLEKAQNDAQAATATVAELQGQIRDANLKVALTDPKHGVASPTLAALAIKAKGIEFDDHNQPVDIDAAVKAAIEAEPALAGTAPKPKAPSTNGGDGGGGGKETEVELTSDELAAAKASGMTPEEYQAYKSPSTVPTGASKD